MSERTPALIGEHYLHGRCRFCGSLSLEQIIDLGAVPLAGGFFKPGSTAEDFSRERRFPLPVMVCADCFLVQVVHIPRRETLFKDYFYHSSAIRTLVEHFHSYAAQIGDYLAHPVDALLVELGCNDGVFLRPLRELGYRVVGVDPASNVVAPLVADGFDIVEDFFGEESAQVVRKRFGQADAVLSSNSFAHIDDMSDVMRGVDLLLKDDGFLGFEVHYLPTLLREMQYDMIYHEHMSYYSLKAVERFMARFEMEVFDVVSIPLHAGSVRFLVQKAGKGRRAIAGRVAEMRAAESAAGIDRLDTYREFSSKVAKTRADLMSLVRALKNEGRSIAGYGASGRATTMSAYCGLTAEHLDYVIDDAPAKQGAFTPGNHLPIRSGEVLQQSDRPDYVLLFAWAFVDEVLARNSGYLASGGRFIIPLPEVRVVGG